MFPIPLELDKFYPVPLHTPGNVCVASTAECSPALQQTHIYTNCTFYISIIVSGSRANQAHSSQPRITKIKSLLKMLWSILDILTLLAFRTRPSLKTLRPLKFATIITIAKATYFWKFSIQLNALHLLPR